ncbi:MAG: type II toxin-antitoxin system VapC family toxin [bacterium]
MKAYIDSDILIWHLRGDFQALKFLKKIRDNEEYELCTGALQRAEVVFFMREEEKQDTLLFLSMFKTIPVDQQIVDVASELYRTWNPGYGLDINDTFLAATAMLQGGVIYTKNKKHYPMPEIKVYKAW